MGLDPGITTGLAILDIRGRVLFIGSKRDVKKSDIIKQIVKFGRPLIFASDVNPLPQSIDKMAASFGCKTYFPEESLALVEKIELTRDYELEIKNNHERDALAAAIKAYKKYRELFSKIERTLGEIDHMEIFEEVAKRMLKDEGGNINDVVKEIIEEKRKPEPEIVVKKVMTEKEYQNLVERLRNKLARREEDLKIIKEYSENLKKTIEELKFKIKKMDVSEIVDKEIERLWRRISILENEIAELKRVNEMMRRMRRIEDEGKIPLIDIEDCSIGNLIEINKNIDLKNRIVYCNSSDLTTLNEFGIRALVRKTPLSQTDLEKLEFPVVTVSDEQIEKYEEIKTIKQELFEKEVRTARKTGLIEWLKRYKKRKV